MWEYRARESEPLKTAAYTMGFMPPSRDGSDIYYLLPTVSTVGYKYGVGFTDSRDDSRDL